MNKLNFKMATRGIKNNKFLYFPYILASSFMLFIFNLLIDLKSEKFILETRGSEIIKSLLEMGSWIVAIFSLIFLVYMAKTIVKNRYKELGLLYGLGMDKKSLRKILIIENLILGISTLIIGSFLVILLGPLFINLVAKILKIQMEIKLSVNFSKLILGLIIFAIIFILITLISLNSIRKTNPIELSKLSQKGESEPKANVISMILAVILIGYGYYTALSINGGIFQALPKFLPASIAVIIGTYFFFRSLVIWILKLFRKNKKIYYKGTNMTFIGELIKRSKESAMALSSITIISSLFLLSFVVMSAMFIGKNDLLDRIAPSDFLIQYQENDKESEKYGKNLLEKNIDKEKIENLGEFRRKGLVVSEKSPGKFSIIEDDDLRKTIMDEKTKIISLTDIKSFNMANKTNISLKKDQAIVFDSKAKKYGKISLENQNLKVKENVKNTSYVLMDPTTSLFHNIVLVVDDMDEFSKKISDGKNIKTFPSVSGIYFDLKDKSQKNIDYMDKNLNENISDNILVKNSIENRIEFDKIHTGAYIVVTILALVFLISTIVVIYYKQAAEGLEDGRNIKILQKVGMSKKEIKNSVKKQNYFTFFGPLIISIIHILIASKLAFGMIQMFAMLELRKFIEIEAICIIIFSLIYIMIFRITLPIYFEMGKLNKE
ncbi:ABC transporter permease [Anaerococcus hydrogenalis]|uniref:ABC transporter permease n=1 Tax=Anaerococcus hydrogenalis TaxID=33029 RepID=A0A2N6UJ26_9FIRM|nr:ABC transporter permease [Anaerococcus hydrogenalis]MDK7694930.1 ABC transporter permease [Anaerococcus hydrogenalis]MDK7707957.1 ABC transporter permease [Anaerococcus hydrogenalis]PMC81562.1 ABC transporter permease [Anaerococcus hydrogenalis]